MLLPLGYTVVVGTSMKHAAGIDANVYIKIYGTDGNSGEINAECRR